MCTSRFGKCVWNPNPLSVTFMIVTEQALCLRMARDIYDMDTRRNMERAEDHVDYMVLHVLLIAASLSRACADVQLRVRISLCDCNCESGSHG